MIKAIIFDCFGVLVGKGFWHTYTAAGGDVRKDMQFIEDVLIRSNAGEIDDGTFNQIIADRLGMNVGEWRERKDREEQPNLELFHYIESDLRPHYKIGFLSNVGHGVIERLIPSELRALFDVDIRSANVGFQKPDRRIYQLALDRLGVSPEEAVFTDDHEEYLVGAEGLGIKTVKYNDLPTFRAKLEQILALNLT